MVRVAFGVFVLCKRKQMHKLLFGMRLLLARGVLSPRDGEHFSPSPLRRSCLVGRRIVEEWVPAAYQGSAVHVLFIYIFSLIKIIIIIIGYNTFIAEVLRAVLRARLQ